MAEGGANLLRRREEPRAMFLELFFDLVFVFALAQLSVTLLERLSWSHLFKTLVLLLALFWVWTRIAAATEVLDPRHPLMQLLVIATMFGTLVMAAAAPEAFGKRGLVFAGGYVAIQIGGHVAFVLMLRGHDAQQHLFTRALFWFGVSAVPWIAGAFAHGWARVALWTLAAVIDYTVATLRWPTPWLGRTRVAELPLSGPHLAERYQQFFIIALGELVLVTGLTFARTDFKAENIAAAMCAFACEALIWRIYFHRAGGLLGEAVTAAPDPFRVAVPALFSHLIMIAGIVAFSVEKKLVIAHPFGHTQPAWISVLFGGPALFLIGRAIFEYAVFNRVSRNRVIGVLVLAAISPAMIVLPPLAVCIAADLVLAAVAISDAIHTPVGRPPEPPSPPR
jgi:low temperature requirement protein LtrA